MQEMVYTTKFIEKEKSWLGHHSSHSCCSYKQPTTVTKIMNHGSTRSNSYNCHRLPGRIATMLGSRNLGESKEPIILILSKFGSDSHPSLRTEISGFKLPNLDKRTRNLAISWPVYKRTQLDQKFHMHSSESALELISLLDQFLPTT